MPLGEHLGSSSCIRPSAARLSRRSQALDLSSEGVGMWRGEHRCRRKEDGVWLDAKAEIDSSGGKWEAKHDLVYGADGVMRLAPLLHLTPSGYRMGRWFYLAGDFWVRLVLSRDCKRAWKVWLKGASFPALRSVFTTMPFKASYSRGFPASRSWSMEGLKSPRL